MNEVGTRGADCTAPPKGLVFARLEADPLDEDAAIPANGSICSEFRAISATRALGLSERNPMGKPTLPVAMVLDD